MLLLVSALTSILILAIYRAAKPDEQILWYAALLGGFGWEAPSRRSASTRSYSRLYGSWRAETDAFR